MRSAQNSSLVALSDGPILLLFHKIYCRAVSVEKKSTSPLLTFRKSHQVIAQYPTLLIPDIKRCPENCVLPCIIFHVQTVFFLSLINAKSMATNPSPSSHIPVGLNFLFPKFESKI